MSNTDDIIKGINELDDINELIDIINSRMVVVADLDPSDMRYHIGHRCNVLLGGGEVRVECVDCGQLGKFPLSEFGLVIENLNPLTMQSVHAQEDLTEPDGVRITYHRLVAVDKEGKKA